MLIWKVKNISVEDRHDIDQEDHMDKYILFFKSIICLVLYPVNKREGDGMSEQTHVNSHLELSYLRKW